MFIDEYFVFHKFLFKKKLYKVMINLSNSISALTIIVCCPNIKRPNKKIFIMKGDLMIQNKVKNVILEKKTLLTAMF